MAGRNAIRSTILTGQPASELESEIKDTATLAPPAEPPLPENTAFDPPPETTPTAKRNGAAKPPARSAIPEGHKEVTTVRREVEHVPSERAAPLIMPHTFEEAYRQIAAGLRPGWYIKCTRPVPFVAIDLNGKIQDLATIETFETYLRGWGGGEYCVNVFDNKHSNLHLQKVFVVDPDEFGGPRMFHGKGAAPVKAPATVESGESKELAEEKTRAEKARIRRDEAKAEAEHSAQMAALAKKNEVPNAEMEALKREIEDLKKKNAEIAAAPKAEPLVDQLVKLAPLILALKEIFPKPAAPPPVPVDNSEKLLTIMTNANQQIMAMATQSIKDAVAAIYKKTTGESSIESYQRMEDKMLNKFERLGILGKGSAGIDDINIDAKNIWGSLLAEGAKGLVWLVRTGGPEAAKILAEKVGRTQAEVMAKYNAAEAAKAAPPVPGALPPPSIDFQWPGNVPRAQQPASPPPPPPPLDPNIDFNSFTQPEMPQANLFPPIQAPAPPSQPPPPPLEMAAPPPAPPPPNVAVVASQQVPPAPPSVQASQANGADNPMEEDLRGWLDSTMEIAIVDFTAQKAEHDWMDTALAKWHKAFLDELVRVDNSADCAVLIEKKASPAVWARFQPLISRGDNAYRFLSEIAMLVNAHKRNAVGGPR